MTSNRLLKALILCPIMLCLALSAMAQGKTITGKITDEKGSPVVGASVTVKGGKGGTTTDAAGSFKLNAPVNTTTVSVTYVGYASQDVDVSATSEVTISLTPDNSTLTDVVVVGYGTVRKKDLTGAVASVKEKEFNKGVQTSADLLIQGKVAGVQVLNNSGQPGGGVSVRIRGTASVRTGGQPLYVVDGVPLDGRSSRPGYNSTFGNTPDANPLNFINPNDIASMDVLKDASATAIYGSRGANGVIIITTKRGQSGQGKLDYSAYAGFNDILKKLDVLSASQYRQAIQAYNASGDSIKGTDWGSSTDALEAITRKGFIQNHNVSFSGGNENARIRASLGYLDQDGIVRKSSIKRYTANLNGQFKFLNSKRLGVDLNIIASQSNEQIAPVSTNAGFTGSLIGQALQWNPTRSLRNEDGSLNIKGPNFPGDEYNPLAVLEYYDDKAKTTTVLASASPYFKFTDALEYRATFSVNYGTGIRRSQVSNLINIPGIEGVGIASYANNELLTQQATHTLNFNKQINPNIFLGATLGYEYLKYQSKGVGFGAQNFTSNGIPYTDYFQGSSTTNRGVGSFDDPSSELQSYFGRVNINLKDKYLLTATFRADGSNKFGENNKYGYFPSFAAAWNISNEDFMKSNVVFSQLKLRVGWGETGNQEFPSGSAQEQFAYVGPNAIQQVNVANPDLKWETSSTTNIGIDFGILRNRISGSIEYFYKNTDDLLFNFDAIQPAPAAKYWINLNGNVVNSGAEVTINSSIVRGSDFNFDLGVFASFLHNELKNYSGPTILTGEINGQGLSGAYAERLANGQPLNSFYMGRFLEIDKDGIYRYQGGDPNIDSNRFFVGSPNPKTILGISGTFSYKKLSLVLNMNGAFGFKIYNNTVQATLAAGNLKNNRNIAASEFNPSTLVDLSQPQPVSTRFLEKGNYMKMANATLSYNVGSIGNAFKNLLVYVTGQNLFVLTDYTGFDPEVNTPKPINGVPSFGIEYTPYPSARTFVFGVNLSL